MANSAAARRVLFVGLFTNVCATVISLSSVLEVLLRPVFFLLPTDPSLSNLSLYL